MAPSSPQAIAVATFDHSDEIWAITSLKGAAHFKSEVVSPVILVQRRLISP